MERVFDALAAQAEQKKRRNRQLVLLLPILLLLLLAYLLRVEQYLTDAMLDADYIYIAAALMVAAVVINTLAQWRCPGCRTALGLRWNPAYCPGCGIRLNKEKTN